MSDRTGIEWTDATWNPVTGCTKVSPGCDHCYAETIAHRFAGTKAYPDGFDVTLRPERLDQPLRWRRTRRIFVNSMSDLFHDQVPDDYIASVFGVMAANYCHDRPAHTFQILTKRHGRMRSLLSSAVFRRGVAESAANYTSEDWADNTYDAIERNVWPLPNVWLGVSVEDQKRADLRIPALLDTPAAVRFLSCEPLLGPVCLDLMHSHDGHAPGTALPCRPESGIDWLIVGGESGPHARPMHPAWARSLRDQCTAAGVPFHFKQWGEWGPGSFDRGRKRVLLSRDGVVAQYMEPGEHIRHFWRGSADVVLERVGKKAAGRQLDGRTWDEFPEAVTAP